jgi:hypothetical protein
MARVGTRISYANCVNIIFVITEVLYMIVRWDPQRSDSLFFHQSAVLQATFYHLQIVIHRPYIARKSTSPSLPSLAICTNAARANSRLLDILSHRTDGPFPWITVRLFITFKFCFGLICYRSLRLVRLRYWFSTCGVNE